MKLGLMFFSSPEADNAAPGKYGLLLDAARFADREGLCAVWTPERHFHRFGGLFPNPGITSAALATITSRVQLRAGSLITPLHNEIRVAEDWAVIDNLSGGRVAISFGSGWNIDDFVLWPGRYGDRKELVFRQVETVRQLWRGDPAEHLTVAGSPVQVRLHPRPVQPELPVWITSSGDPRTFERAGQIGANLLTHLVGHDLTALAEKIGRYRRAYAASGALGTGVVTLMLHTFVGSDDNEVRDVVRAPMREYLESAIQLEQRAAAGGGTISGGRVLGADAIPRDLLDELVEMRFEQYYQEASLLGTPDRCLAMLRRLATLGIDEIACLVDFGVPDDLVLQALKQLPELAAAAR